MKILPLTDLRFKVGRTVEYKTGPSYKIQVRKKKSKKYQKWKALGWRALHLTTLIVLRFFNFIHALKPIVKT